MADVTLTHKLRNPKSYNKWMNIWTATVHDPESQEASPEYIITPSKNWQIPVNQVVKVTTNAVIETKNEAVFPIWQWNEQLEKYEYFNGNIEEVRDHLDQYHCKIKEDPETWSTVMDTIDSFNSFEDSTYIIQEVIYNNEETGEIEEGIEKRPLFQLVVSYTTTQEQEEEIYNATVQTTNKSIPVGQIAVFSDEGRLVPLSLQEGDEKDDSFSEDKFLNKNKEWKSIDNYNLNDDYLTNQFVQGFKNFLSNNYNDGLETNNEIDDNYKKYFDIEKRMVEEEEKEYYILNAKGILLRDIPLEGNSSLTDISLMASNLDDNKDTNKGSVYLTNGNLIQITKDIDHAYKISSTLTSVSPQYDSDNNITNYTSGYITGPSPSDITQGINKNVVYGLDENGRPGWYSIRQLSNDGGYKLAVTNKALTTYTSSSKLLTFGLTQVVTNVTLSKITNSEGQTEYQIHTSTANISVSGVQLSLPASVTTNAQLIVVSD